MGSDTKNRFPPLAIVPDAAPSSANGTRPEPDGLSPMGGRDLDWSVYMARAQAGDKAAYRRLLEEIVPYLRSLAVRNLQNRGDIEDVVQDVLLTVHAIRHTYDPARPFGPWLVAIANRRIVDRLRRQGRCQARETPLEAEHETFAAPETNLQEAESDSRVLREAIDRLPPGQRAAIRLVKLREMSLKEAAAVSGTSIASLKVATHRALKNLRKLLGRQDDKT